MSTNNWFDYFSAVAGDYARFRPHYPAALFSYLAGLAPAHNRAWDCATGNGQAAIAWAEHFTQVIATDASAEQIEHPLPHSRVTYRCATAEDSGLAEHSCDLVSVAQALHWFDLDAFYAEVARVLRPGGVLAVWSYAVMTIDDPQLDAHVNDYYANTLAPYWSPRRRWVEEGYRSLPFPFDECPREAYDHHDFSLWRSMDLEGLAGYLSTWSATQKYRDHCAANHQADPFPALCQQLREHWPAQREQLQVRWPLNLRISIKPG